VRRRWPGVQPGICERRPERSPAMSDDDHVYGEVNNEGDLRRIFAEIRRHI
jgi:hypothetical protein